MAPAPLPEDDPRNPRFDPRYAGIPDAALPRTESLKDTVARTMPYWECEILPALARHDELLVVAHGNSLRGIIKNLKGISDEAISEFNLPTAVPYVFEFDEGLGCVKVVCRSVFDPVLCLGRRTGFACRRSSPDRK